MLYKNCSQQAANYRSCIINLFLIKILADLEATMCIWILALIGLLYLVYHVRMKLTKGVCRSRADLTNKTAIVTGSDKGIGYFTALDLARRNARVILACRNLETANAAAEEIRKATGNQNVVVRKLDVSSLASVRSFADDIVKREARLDILVNNAGIGGNLKVERTDERFEKVFVTNYLGHFLLTMLLVDLLKRSAPSRVVNVSSIAHRWFGPLDVENLNCEKKPKIRQLYSYSKLAQILFSRFLGRRLGSFGVTVNAAHPGSVQTNLFPKMRQPYGMFMGTVAKLFFRTAEEGAQTSIYLAVSEDVKSKTGQYFSECRLDKPASYAVDDITAEKLFERSLAYCQLKNPL